MEPIDKLLISCILESLYQSDNTFVSHLIGSTPYQTYSIVDINNFLNPTISVDALNATSDFSKLIHQMPRGKVFNPRNDLLSDEYSLFLKTVALADDAPSGKNIHTDMPPEMQQHYTKYKEFREDLFNEITDYNDKLKDNKNDEAWNKDTKPLLLGIIESHHKQWDQDGFKNEIETYIDKKIVNYNLTFSSLWALWRGKFIESLSTKSDFKGPGSSYAAFYTDFSKITDEKNWQKSFDNHDTITKHLDNNPIKTKAAEVAQYASTIENFGFSYLKLDIERSWFVPKVFESRFWVLSHAFEGETVSDGQLGGNIPCYITNWILIKDFSKEIRKGILELGLGCFGAPLFKLLNRKTTPTKDDCYYLAAVICKTIPKCPNPDKNLKWS